MCIRDRAKSARRSLHLQTSADPDGLNAVLVWFILVFGGSLLIRELLEVFASAWILFVPIGFLKGSLMTVSICVVPAPGWIFGPRAIELVQVNWFVFTFGFQGPRIGPIWSVKQSLLHVLAVASKTSLIARHARGLLGGDPASEIRAVAKDLVRCFLAVLSG